MLNVTFDNFFRIYIAEDDVVFKNFDEPNWVFDIAMFTILILSLIMNQHYCENLKVKEVNVIQRIK